MNLTKLKEKNIRRQFNKKLSNSKGQTVNSQKIIQSVGILTTDEISSKMDILKELETILGVRNVKMYSYRKFNKTDEESFKHFSEKNINWKGEYVQENFQSFLEQPFDLLIGYFNTSHLYLECAVLQSNARFKVGFSNVNSDLYQMEISNNLEEIKSFFTELKKYLIILKKIKN
ncbi:DUF6913 domain-containing protein [Polaribacter septentrionalilitoris]|uniref:DUF6913 domain-containing protein n=1 Tax=Polaribacter septentrionalilitoris TaxID=2494657 RepID=UPI001F412DD8|nr:hypothetical protein [Polaribacter septentrionalilitoris]